MLLSLILLADIGIAVITRLIPQASAVIIIMNHYTVLIIIEVIWFRETEESKLLGGEFIASAIASTICEAENRKCFQKLLI